MPGSAREEAERLVAAILARASASPAGGHSSGDGFGLLGESVAGLIGMLSRDDLATGSAECCVCPVCRAIAAVRDPSPETAERIAASAGDIASGVAGLMRAFSSLAAEKPRPPAPRAKPSRTPDQAWSAATRADIPAARPDGDPLAPDARDDPWGAASAADAREVAAETRARAQAAERERARAEAAAARARAAAAEQAVARAVERAAAARAAAASRPGGARGDVWAMATADAPESSVMGTTEVAADDAAEPRSVDHDLGASAPEDRDAGQGDDARPGGAV
ncbi:hypothetical protein [Actinoplanes sp. NPDC049802]|uniref:hypothetical protein n=1 Tax=Actinoplanes sp. NPDC049802 TaxID=3154742 RepID=UPI0033D5F5FD